ncbi:MAG: hypothetical protein ACOCUV_00320 [bacterium]
MKYCKLLILLFLFSLSNAFAEDWARYYNGIDGMLNSYRDYIEVKSTEDRGWNGYHNRHVYLHSFQKFALRVEETSTCNIKIIFADSVYTEWSYEWGRDPLYVQGASVNLDLRKDIRYIKKMDKTVGDTHAHYGSHEIYKIYLDLNKKIKLTDRTDPYETKYRYPKHMVLVFDVIDEEMRDNFYKHLMDARSVCKYGDI